MYIDIQRLRNLTTGKLHTDIKHVYEDIENIVGEKGIMTHQIPNAMRALEPWLKREVTDRRFWDGKHDPHHVGTVEIQSMIEAEQDEFWERYMELPSPFSKRN